MIIVRPIYFLPKSLRAAPKLVGPRADPKRKPDPKSVLV